jgi:3-deoxy-manno-octulosonate cytidylyltransferase (CMP-KDO synthetase)
MMILGNMSKTPTIIVPTRLTSSRFPRKLLHPVRGKPVVLWTAERIRRVAPEFPLFFAVDDAELEACLEEAGFQTVMTRNDHTSGTDRLAEANARIGAEAVINVQGDEPLVTGAQIRALADGLNNGAAIATLAVRFTQGEDVVNPNQVKVIRDRTGLALYFSRSVIPFVRDCSGVVDDAWLAVHPVYRHLGLYAYQSEFLSAFAMLEPGYLEGLEKLEQLRAMEHGYRIHVGVTTEATIGIDTPEDIAAFEARLDGSIAGRL